MSEEEMLKAFDKEIIHVGGCHDTLEKLKAYYAGDEQGLREINMVWMGSITISAN